MSKNGAGVPTLPAKEALILELLVAGGDMYGLELVAGSSRRLKRGTVYVTLGRMEDKGYITSRLETDQPATSGLPRRIYSPTPFGRRVLAAWTKWTHVAMRLDPGLAR